MQNKHGKEITIKRACYVEVGRYLAKQRANIYHTESICDLDKRESSVSFDYENPERDHTVADTIVEKMKLTDSERDWHSGMCLA